MTNSNPKYTIILSKLFNEFFNCEKSSGFILIACLFVSLAITNSSIGWGYQDFWHIKLSSLTISYWINDALMTIFFLLVGLEIEREIYIGEISNFKNALLPLSAAIGGMLLPAIIHFIFNSGSPTASGFGIPMATDIAFALGILSLGGKSVPPALKIFLTALAIIDDLGAIIIIAIFYTNELSLLNLSISLGIFLGLFIMGKKGVNNLLFYIIPGAAMWYFMLKSGVHATISGVLLAFAIPFRKNDETSPSYKLQHFLHKPVAFFIIPLFALANTGISLGHGFYTELLSSNSLGIMIGLFIGKPLGILSFSWIAVKTKLSSLPASISWKHITGAGILAGIGFTMSIFITLLAFTGEELVTNSKVAILCASAIAAITGLIVIRSTKIKSEA